MSCTKRHCVAVHCVISVTKNGNMHDIARIVQEPVLDRCWVYYRLRCIKIYLTVCGGSNKGFKLHQYLILTKTDTWLVCMLYLPVWLMEVD